MDRDGDVERRLQKIYYGPLEHKKRAVYLFLLAVVILVLAVWLVYQPIGNGLAGGWQLQCSEMWRRGPQSN